MVRASSLEYGWSQVRLLFMPIVSVSFYSFNKDPVHCVGLLVSMLTDVASSAKTVGTAEFLRAATDRPIAYVPH